VGRNGDIALNSYFIEDLKAGMEASYERNVTEADIIAFAAVSGDTNPMHLDEAYAATTDFKGRIAHGMLTASYISTVIGTKLPGPGAIYLSQSLRFMAPVRIGDVVRAVVRVIHLDPRRRRARLACFCFVGATVVLEGEANVKVPSRG
jgi:3-hydroxybutyryl-CoA dehydratase